jgi:3-hydroxybutyryl-CoA dehydrogenase
VPQHIFIIGESSLVREYAALSSSKRQAVTARLNPGETGQLSKGVKRAATPPKSVTIALELTNVDHDIKKRNLILLDRSLAANIPVVTSSVAVAVAEQATWVKHPNRLIGIGALPSQLEGPLVELATSNQTSNATITRARDLLASLGKEVALVQDTIGLVMPRILCMLANEAYFAMMEGVATGKDIDTAMKLGTNYPSGPVERAERIGIRTVHAVLEALHNHFGEDRYRIAPFLRQAALVKR